MKWLLLRRVLLAAAVLAPMAAHLAPTAAHAQDRGTFLVIVGSDTVFVERFTRTADSVAVQAELKGQARMQYTLLTAAQSAVTEINLRMWPADAAPSAPPAQVGRVVFSGDVATTTLDAGGGPREATVPNARGALPMLNPSPVMIEQVLMRARALSPRDSVSVPVLVLGRPQTVSATVRWVGADSAVMSIGPVEVHARIDAAGRMQSASVPSQNLTIVRTAEARAAAPAKPKDALAAR